MSRLQVRFAWHRAAEVVSYPPNRIKDAVREEARPPDTIALYEEEGPHGIQRFVGETALGGDEYLGDFSALAVSEPDTPLGGEHR